MVYVILTLIGLDFLLVMSCCKMGSIQSRLEERDAERRINECTRKQEECSD